MLWDFNRFLPEKPCQTGALAEMLLLMLIDVLLLVLLLASCDVILAPSGQCGWAIAALLTRMSIPPIFASTSVTIRLTSAATDTSA